MGGEGGFTTTNVPSASNNTGQIFVSLDCNCGVRGFAVRASFFAIDDTNRSGTEHLLGAG